jgi:LAO/AO transport system kinase
VAVVAVDPSSPFTGGAVLGDRIRMGEHQADEGVFIRSLASRGHLGGLSRAAADAIDVFDAAGYDTIITETVGAGQSEVEITRVADTRLVVCPPGLGDDVQAIKAGVLEIADAFVVSKADLPDAQRTERDLQAMLALRRSNSWPPARGWATVRMTVGPQHLNFNGGCHGGAIFSLADTALGMACNSHGDDRAC